jgi:hypothetical protein
MLRQISYCSMADEQWVLVAGKKQRRQAFAQAQDRLRRSLQHTVTFVQPAICEPLALAASRLDLHIRSSSISGAGLGVFACRAFQAGEVVGYVHGKVVSAEVWASISTDGMDPTHRDGEEDFAAPFTQGVNCCAEIDLQADGTCKILVSRQCPMAFINDPRDADKCNISIVCTGRGQLSCDATQRSKVFPVLATRVIRAGDELMTDYGWTQAAWNDVLRRAHASRTSAASLISTPRLRRCGSSAGKQRSIMVGAPSRQDALAQQQRLLDNFIQQFQAELLATSRYAIRTQQLSTVSPPAISVHTARSSLFPGLMGTFADAPVCGVGQEVVLVEYPGVLMSDAMLEKFNRMYHVPTAVRVQGLDYHHVKMNLVGEPTHPGPIVNDGGFSSLPSSCSRCNECCLHLVMPCSFALCCVSCPVSNHAQTTAS